jgi:hypothetical protein
MACGGPVVALAKRDLVTTPRRSTGNAFWTTIVNKDIPAPRPRPITTMSRASSSLPVATVIVLNKYKPDATQAVPTMARRTPGRDCPRGRLSAEVD